MRCNASLSGAVLEISKQASKRCGAVPTVSYQFCSKEEATKAVAHSFGNSKGVQKKR